MFTIGPLRFTSVLTHFKAQYPGISLSLVEGTPPRLTERLESGEIDVAIMAQSDGFPERFKPHPLYAERFFVAFPVGHRLAKHRHVPLAELDGENYLQRLNCEYLERIETCMVDRNCQVTTVYESEREDWILNMVAGGLGISTIPEFSATAPGIEVRPLTDPVITRDICLVSMAGRRQSPAVSSFVKTVSQFSWPMSAVHDLAAA
jgi:DNA-binding transcriptional LysR family regulator